MSYTDFCQALARSGYCYRIITAGTPIVNERHYLLWLFSPKNAKYCVRFYDITT